MPVYTPDESLNAIIDSIPGLRSQLEAEAANTPAPNVAGLGVAMNQATPPQQSNPLENLIPTLQNQIGDLTRAIYPTSPLNEEDQARYASLASRNQRLAPMDQVQYGEVGTPGIRGNPYSTDTRSLHSGLNNLARGIGNRIRSNRREEFAPELQELHNRQQTNIANQQAGDEFFQKFFPTAFTQHATSQRTGAQIASREEEGAANRESRETIASASADLRRELQKDQQNFQKELETLRSGTTRHSPSLTTGTAKIFTDASSRFASYARDLERIKGGDLFNSTIYPDIDDDISALNAKASQASILALKAYRPDGIDHKTLERDLAELYNELMEPDPSEIDTDPEPDSDIIDLEDIWGDM